MLVGGLFRKEIVRTESAELLKVPPFRLFKKTPLSCRGYFHIVIEVTFFILRLLIKSYLSCKGYF
jgi:hypothetical protein